jgi:hypothetical protein
VSSSPIQAEGVTVFIAGDDGSTPRFVQASAPRAIADDEALATFEAAWPGGLVTIIDALPSSIRSRATGRIRKTS